MKVTEKDVDSFLCNFPLLERLKVCSSLSLRGVTVRGSSLALKHLEICHNSCLWSTHVVVHDTSLVSLTIHSLSKLSLVNNPKLVDVRSARWLRESENILGQLSGCLSTVQNLTFDTAYYDHLEDIDMVPELSEVKQLTLAIDPLRKDSLSRLTNLLSLSPKLEKLVLEFVFRLKNLEIRKRVPSWLKSKLSNRRPRFPVEQRVKVVEVRGYYGDVAENKALRGVFRQFVATPERVIFNLTNLGSDLISPYSDHRLGVEPSAEKRAELLKKLLPSSVEFIVI